MLINYPSKNKILWVGLLALIASALVTSLFIFRCYDSNSEISSSRLLIERDKRGVYINMSDILTLVQESFDSASEIALADDEVKQIIGNDHFLLSYSIRGISSNAVNLLLMTEHQNNLVIVDLDQEKVKSIESADGPDWSLPELSEIPEGQCSLTRGDESSVEDLLQICIRG